MRKFIISMLLAFSIYTVPASADTVSYASAGVTYTINCSSNPSGCAYAMAYLNGILNSGSGSNVPVGCTESMGGGIITCSQE